MKKSVLILLLICSFYFSGYSQWVPINTDTTVENYGVDFLNKDTGYVVGDGYPYGMILRTEDGGLTWDSTRINGLSGLFAVSAPTDSVAYTGGQDGAVFKTTDAGQNWVAATTLPGWYNDFAAMHFIDKNTGF